ncbi:hypothetical protein [Paenibacillus sp. YIM B09110]|uniref:hypothetical protein n=1 Tax=Paenibacillus sp. YIM B09110 TaxID=3126102 RepID=UPI00301D5A33
MLNALQLFGEAKNTYGSTRTFTECQDFINAFDWDAHRLSERANYELVLYDKVSAINGISPELILADAPVGGEVILVYIGGKLTIIQKHDPSQSGFVAMDVALATEIGNGIIDNFVETKVDEIARETVLIQMIS